MTAELNDFIKKLEQEHSLTEFYLLKQDIVAMLKELGGIKPAKKETKKEEKKDGSK